MSSPGDGEQLTRKQRREQAREQRKAMERAEVASAARRTRLTQLGAVATVVVVAIVVILVATSGGGNKVVKSGSPEASKTAKDVNALVGGIPQSGNVLGNPSAPVTLQYFGDLECPGCREFTLGALPSLIGNYVRAGKLKIAYRALETASREPEVFRSQQIAALAAGKQAKMWDYLEIFYREQGEEGSGYVTESYLKGLAAQVTGLNLAAWSAARNDPAFQNAITTDARAANTAAFTGTPSFLIGKTGGSMQKLEYSSLTDPSSFNAAIEHLLKA
jgi:protein-disulfide isomerase